MKSDTDSLDQRANRIVLFLLDQYGERIDEAVVCAVLVVAKLGYGINKTTAWTTEEFITQVESSLRTLFEGEEKPS